MKSESEWAIRNLELAGFFDKDSIYNGMIGEAVKKLIELHSNEGHSGMSHNITIDLFNKVMKGEALTMEFWQERFEAYNKASLEHGVSPWTEKNFEEIVMRKPNA